MLLPPSAALGYIVRTHAGRGGGGTQGMVVTCSEDELTLVPTGSILFNNEQPAWYRVMTWQETVSQSEK